MECDRCRKDYHPAVEDMCHPPNRLAQQQCLAAADGDRLIGQSAAESGTQDIDQRVDRDGAYGSLSEPNRGK